jgi:hypothetical protein
LAKGQKNTARCRPKGQKKIVRSWIKGQKNISGFRSRSTNL